MAALAERWRREQDDDGELAAPQPSKDAFDWFVSQRAAFARDVSDMHTAIALATGAFAAKWGVRHGRV